MNLSVAKNIPNAKEVKEKIDQRMYEEKSKSIKTVAVLFGGCSPEYSVSLQSASAVIQQIDQTRYDLVLIGISKKGEWFLFEGDPQIIEDDSWCNKKYCVPVYVSQNRTERCVVIFRNEKLEKKHIDVALPIMHGKNGEDGTVQGVFELAGIPIIGCGVLASALCMDKDRAHKMVSTVGVSVPKSFTINKSMDVKGFMNKANEMGYPLFVKPIRAGSSFGITKISDCNEFIVACERAFTYDENIIIEEFIEGFEVGCAVLGNEKLIVGEIDEIELSKGFFDFDEKYSLKTSSIHVPARISDETAKRIKETAKLIYKCLDCKDFARVDMFLTSNEEIVFNEVNTIPGFTSHSRYPNMMKAAGITFKQIVERLLELGGEICES
jgi:D-alanine--D-alanine ligase